MDKSNTVKHEETNGNLNQLIQSIVILQSLPTSELKIKLIQVCREKLRLKLVKFLGGNHG